LRLLLLLLRRRFARLGWGQLLLSRALHSLLLLLLGSLGGGL